MSWLSLCLYPLKWTVKMIHLMQACGFSCSLRLSRGGPGFNPVVRGRGLWRFTCHPSTLETVYLSWFAWPRKWRSRLTDIEWDLKEPLRITSSLAVTTLSTLYIYYTPYTCKASWCGHSGLRLWTERFWVRGLGCCGMALCPWARHFTCMCTLWTQEWIGAWLDSDCLCIWIVTSPVMAAGLCSPGSWVGAGTNGSYNKGKLTWNV